MTDSFLDSGSIKFCVFADIHYEPGQFPHSTKEWLGRILARAERESCDLVIHLGDLTHSPARNVDYVNYYNDFRIPCYHTIGNHDDDQNSHEETLKAFRLERGYYHFDRKGFRFVVMDTNYMETGGVFTHYSNGNYYGKHDSSDRVPPEELDWLERTLAESPYPCVITSHTSFERHRSGSPDGPAVRAIIDAANAKRPGLVRLVLSGHFHRNFVRILHNVVYVDLASASYDFMGHPHDAYPKEVAKACLWGNHVIMWEDPLSAIVTLDGKGHIRFEGEKSRFFLGISPEQAGYPPLDGDSRPCRPEIDSFEI